MISLPNKPAPVIKHFLDKNKPLVYRYVIKKIKQALHSNLESIEVFEHKNKIEYLKQKDFEMTLQNAITEFCKVEDYESAAISKKLLDKVKIKKLIDASKSE